MGRSPWDDAPDGSAAVPPSGPVQLPPMGATHPFDLNDRERYVDGAELGVGGMGRVVSVHDGRLRRDVARKVVLPGLGRDAEARLAREAWVVAQLEHPGIVPVYDAGRAPDGTLFYTMRVIRGRSLRQRLVDADPDARQRLLVHVKDAAHAIGYAHTLGVVHRDLKPDNVLIGEFGETQVVDWGLARTIGEDDWVERGVPDEHRAHTVRGTVLGTPAYMSPEQATGAGADPRSDVWSMGVVLFEVLTGHPPFGGDSAPEVLTAVHSATVPDVPEAPAALDAILRRALERDPAQRYPTCRELADDLERFYAGKAVLAHRMSPRERAMLALRPWRLPIAAAAAALLTVAVVGSVGWSQTRAERDRARHAELEATRAATESAHHLAQALIGQAEVAQRAWARPEGEVLAAHALRLSDSPESRGMVAAFALGPRPTLVSRVARPPGRVLAVDPTGDLLLIAEDDTVSLWSVSTRSNRWSRLLGGREAVLLPETRMVVVSRGIFPDLVWLDLDTGKRRDGPRVTAAKYNLVGAGPWLVNYLGQTVERIDTRTLEITRFDACPGVELSGAHVWPDGRVLVGCTDGSVTEFGAAGKPGLTIPSAAPIAPIAIHALSSDSVVFGAIRGQLQRVHTTAQRRDPVFHGLGGLVRDLAVQPTVDGKSPLVAVAGERGGVQIWDPEEASVVARLPVEGAGSVRFDGDILVTIGATVSRWRLADGIGPSRLESPHGITALAVSPSGDAIAAAHGEGTVRVHELPSGRERFAVRWQDRVVKDVAWSPDGSRLIAAGMGEMSTVTLDAHTGAELGRTEQVGHYRRLGLFADGRGWGVGWLDGPNIWTTPGGQVSAAYQVPDTRFGEAESNAAGTVVALLDEEGAPYRWRMGEEVQRIARTVDAHAIDAFGNGDDVVLAGEWGVARLGDDGERWRTALDDLPLDVAVGPNDRLVGVSTFGGGLRLLDATTGALLATMRGHQERAQAVAFDPQGRWVATAGWDGDIVLWGLGALTAPPAELVETAERAWGLTLDEALAAEVR
ncbi:MAG: WD40 repeat protein [Myxococcota bacterium]|jgi:WD40 repeat protein